MTIKTNMKAGGIGFNHNENLVVRSNVKARLGCKYCMGNHNESLSTVTRRRRARTALRAIGLALVIGLGVTTLPVSGQESGGKVRERFSLFQHDTNRQSIDLGEPGPSVGDQLVIGGDVYNHEGGTQVGRSAAHCIFSSEAQILCSAAFTVEGGQITFQGIVDIFTFFTNHPVDFAITGGTGPYRNARGTVTVLILPGVLNGTDSVLTVDLR
jgi:hypothetical protein